METVGFSNKTKTLFCFLCLVVFFLLYFVIAENSNYFQKFAKKISGLTNLKHDVNITNLESMAPNMSYENIDKTQDFSSAVPSARTPITTINDVTITIKSTKRFHNNRVNLLLKTWMKKVLNQV